ncbi:MAG: hypothetical protein DME61_11725 [Verrucomicrobia bacterium]|nr:MAG: hypothetical protein DME61_11725 [Verrucomicrobiota bacterium]
MNVLLDTGPLVALLDRSEPDHDQVQSFMARLGGSRLVTTGAVITEAFYFLSDVRDGPANLAAFLDASATDVRDAFSAEALASAVGLMKKYADIRFASEKTGGSNCCSTSEVPRNLALVIRLVLDILKGPGMLRECCWFTVRNTSLSVVRYQCSLISKKSETTEAFFRRTL